MLERRISPFVTILPKNCLTLGTRKMLHTLSSRRPPISLIPRLVNQAEVALWGAAQLLGNVHKLDKNFLSDSGRGTLVPSLSNHLHSS